MCTKAKENRLFRIKRKKHTIYWLLILKVSVNEFSKFMVFEVVFVLSRLYFKSSRHKNTILNWKYSVKYFLEKKYIFYLLEKLSISQKIIFGPIVGRGYKIGQKSVTNYLNAPLQPSFNVFNCKKSSLGNHRNWVYQKRREQKDKKFERK